MAHSMALRPVGKKKPETGDKNTRRMFQETKC